MIDDHFEPVSNPFTAILQGDKPGTIIARDDTQRYAIIASMEPEAAIHWLALPFEADGTTESLVTNDRERFLQLIDYAIQETRLRVIEYPELSNGFTIKFHLGAYETIPHPKLHILSVE